MKDNKLVLLGAGGVGKTSLVVQYLQGAFTPSYKPTVEDLYRRTIKMPDGLFHTVEILDTSGSHPFPAMRDLNIRSGRAFILVFDVSDLRSFHEALHLCDTVLRVRGPKVPILLVGNKTDLEDERVVTEEMVQEALKAESRACRYLETSAKDNINVGQLFIDLLNHARQLEEPPQPPRRLSRRLSAIGAVHLAARRRSSTPAALRETSPTTRHEGRCVIT